VYILAIIQVTYGAFVAGLNAGLFYPTFPTMNGEFMPASIMEKVNSSGWVSLTNDITSVQFVHRLLGILIFLLIAAILNNYRPSLLRRNKKLLIALFYIVTLQALLGITAILYSVPFIIAVLHQFTALVFVAILIINLHGSRPGWPDKA